MRLLLILALALPAQAANVLVTPAFGPTSVPASGCKNGHTGASAQAFCDFQFYVLPHSTGVLVRVLASQVDTGDCSGSVCTPTFGWTTADNQSAMYTTGYAITDITTTAGTAVATLTTPANNAPFEVGNVIWITGSPVSNYNGAQTLTAATWDVSNHLATFSWTQGGSPAHCASNCGSVIEACGGSITNHTAQPCRLEYVIQHMTGTGPNQGSPTSGYLVKQAWANQACTLHTWVANAQHPVNDCLFDSGHFYHQTAVDSTYGVCTSGSTAFATTDGTCTWVDDGTTNALPLEVVTGTNYPGIAGTPSPGVFNINSVTCGGACSNAQVNSGEMMVFEWPYLYWINQFNQAAIAHYAGVSWVSQIDYLRIGVIGGGEIFPYQSATIQSNYGFTLTSMSNTYSWAGLQTYIANSAQWVASKPPFKIMASLNQAAGACSPASTCLIMPTNLAVGAMNLPGYSLGSQGLQAADLTSWVAANNPLTSNDFTIQNMTYWPLATWFEQQTLKDSAGPGSSGCSTSQTQTGPLDVLLVFAVQHHTNALEPYATDMLATYDPNYVAGTTFGSGCQPYPSGYGPALDNAANGLPSSTSASFGGARFIGKQSHP